MDRYTKTVLTVIAGCLLVTTAHQISMVPKAYAQEPIKVILCDEEGDCIDIRYNGKLRMFVSK